MSFLTTIKNRKLFPLFFLIITVFTFIFILFSSNKLLTDFFRNNTLNGIKIYTSNLCNSLSDLLDAERPDLINKRLADASIDPLISVIIIVDQHGTIKFATRHDHIMLPADVIVGFDNIKAIQARERSVGLLVSTEDNKFSYYSPLQTSRKNGKLINNQVELLFINFDLSVNHTKISNIINLNSFLMITALTLILIALLFTLKIWFKKETDNLLELINDAENGKFVIRSKLKQSKDIVRIGNALDRLINKIGITQNEMTNNLKLLNSILGSIPLMVFVLDAKDLCFIYINQVGENYLGFTRSELIGKNAFDIFPQEQSELMTRTDKEVLSEMQTVEIKEEHVLVRHHGIRIFHTFKTPIIDDDGIVRYLLGICEDITEKRALENQNYQLKKMESLAKLSSSISTAMNNTFSAIFGMASIHMEQPGENAMVKKSMETIIKAGQHGMKIIKGLQNFSSQVLSEEKILDLNLLIKEKMLLFQRTTLRNINISMELAPGLHSILGDPISLGLAILNLCANAVDAMPNGGTLTLRTFNEERSGVRLEVSDDGCGMSTELMDKALEPFFTTKSHGTSAGLGLPIAYGVVKAHRGKLDIHSNPGEGTTIRIHLPCCLLPDEQTEVSSNGPHPRWVLLVDKDEVIQKATSRLMESLGHLTTTVNYIEEALRILATGQHFDLIILDINLPGIDAGIMISHIRELRPNISVMLTSELSNQHALELVHTTAGVKYLGKPFTLSELQSALAELKL